MLTDDEARGVRGVRQRPAMFIGGTDSRGLHEMTFEVFDEALEELCNGFATRMVVRLHADGTLEVSDDGRVVPCQPLPEFNCRSRFEVLFTRTEVGKNFRGSRHWRVGAGLFGIGLVPTNALSEWLVAETGDGTSTARLRFERGMKVGEIEQTPLAWRGFRVHFKPDATIFSTVCFEQSILVTRLIELAALVQGIQIEFTDLATSESATIQFHEGVADYVRLLNCGQTPVYNEALTVTHHTPEFRLDVAFQHVAESLSRTTSFVNTSLTMDGGSHWVGFQTGLTKAVRNALSLDSTISVDSQALLCGLTAVVSIWVDDPAFEGPTKHKFAHAAIRGTVESLVYRELKRRFELNPELPRLIWQRSQQIVEGDSSAAAKQPDDYDDEFMPNRWTLAEFVKQLPLA